MSENSLCTLQKYTTNTECCGKMSEPSAFFFGFDFRAVAKAGDSLDRKLILACLVLLDHSLSQCRVDPAAGG